MTAAIPIEPGQCIRVECNGDEVGLVMTRHGWAIVRPTEERDRTVEMVALEEPVFEKAYYRIGHRWDEGEAPAVGALWAETLEALEAKRDEYRDLADRTQRGAIALHVFRAQQRAYAGAVHVVRHFAFLELDRQQRARGS